MRGIGPWCSAQPKLKSYMSADANSESAKSVPHGYGVHRSWSPRCLLGPTQKRRAPSDFGHRRVIGGFGGVPMLKTAIRLAGITALLASGLVSEANAAELKVMAGGAMRAAPQELVPAFEKSTGHEVVIGGEPIAPPRPFGAALCGSSTAGASPPSARTVSHAWQAPARVLLRSAG